MSAHGISRAGRPGRKAPSIVAGSREERVGALIEWLSPRERETLRVYLTGASMREMGKKLRVSQGAMSSAIARIGEKYEWCGLTLRRKLGRKRPVWLEKEEAA